MIYIKSSKHNKFLEQIQRLATALETHVFVNMCCLLTSFSFNYEKKNFTNSDYQQFHKYQQTNNHLAPQFINREKDHKIQIH